MNPGSLLSLLDLFAQQIHSLNPRYLLPPGTTHPATDVNSYMRNPWHSFSPIFVSPFLLPLFCIFSFSSGELFTYSYSLAMSLAHPEAFHKDQVITITSLLIWYISSLIPFSLECKWSRFCICPWQMSWFYSVLFSFIYYIFFKGCFITCKYEIF